MSVTLNLLHKNSGTVRRVRLGFIFTLNDKFPMEMQDIETGTHYYYSSFERLAKEWEFPRGKE